MKDLLFNPSLFFSEKSKNEVSFKYPVLIVLVNAILLIGLSILIMNKVKEILPLDGNSFMPYIMIVSVIMGFGTFVYWILFTGILYLISSLFNSEGSFKRTLEFVGYGFVPQIFGGIVNFFVMYYLLPLVPILSQNPQLFSESFSQALANNPLSFAAEIFVILCFLLSANIWTFALVHARNMSTKNAILTVGVPVGLNLAYQIYSLIGGLT
ncbi:MAG: YIP1 family protein [Methanosarcina barkeri]|nr:YIP1 family protein [Methanosarcina sp. ERenArc_MAG2]